MITNDNIYKSILCQIRGVQHKVSQLPLERQMSDEEVVYVIWAPQYHDMGLITYLTQLVSGSHVYGMSALSFIRDPVSNTPFQLLVNLRFLSSRKLNEY